MNVLDENGLKEKELNLQQFSTILGELKMLDQLTSNEELVMEAWNMLWTPGKEEVSETKIW